MNTSVLNKTPIDGKIIFMQYDTNAYTIDEIKSLNVKNVSIYLDVNNDDFDSNEEDYETEVPYVEPVMDGHEKTPIETAIEFRMSRLAQVIFKILYQDVDDTDEGDCFILLDEVAKLKSIIEIKFKLELGIEKYREYLNNLYFLDKQLRNKIAAINFNKSIDRGVSR